MEIKVDIKSTSAKPQFGDEYKLILRGHNNNYNNRVELTYTVSSTTTASDILQYFNLQLNNTGNVQYIENGKTYNESISSVVSGTKLIISGSDPYKNFDFDKFKTVVSGSKLILSDIGWDWESEVFKERDPETCCSYYFYGEGRTQSSLKGKLLIDAFPNNLMILGY